MLKSIFGYSTFKIQNFSSCIVKVFIFFHIMVLQEYWVLTEGRVPLKSVLGDVRFRIVALAISSHEQTQ